MHELKALCALTTFSSLSCSLFSLTHTQKNSLSYIVSVGHTTIMAAVHFFGVQELSQMTFPTNENDDTVYDEAINKSPAPKGAQ